MIGKQIKGKDFYGVLAYNQKKVDRGEGAIIEANITIGSIVMQTKEFNVVRHLRPNLAKAVYHTSLNLPYSDKLSDEEFGNLARDYLQGMGFNDNQYIVYKHTDQDHSHIHIVANRVGFSGEVVSDSQDYKRSEKLIRDLEKKYNLTVLVQNEESNTLTKGEIEKCLRTGEVPERLELQSIIQGILKQNMLMDEFVKKLKKQGIKIKLNKSASGTVSGISFEYKGILFKGSKVHRSLSWSNIKKVINHEQDRNNNPISANTTEIGKTREKTERNLPSYNRNRYSDVRKPSQNLEKNHGTEGDKVNKPRRRFRF